MPESPLIAAGAAVEPINAVIGLLLLLLAPALCAAQAPRPLKHTPLPKLERGLLAAAFAARMDDAASTRYLLTHGGRELILPRWIAGNTPAMYGFSAGMALLDVWAVRRLWRRRHGRLAAGLAVADAAGAGFAGAHNWTICARLRDQQGGR